MIKLGEINKLKVDRISDLAYILTDGFEELFLHKREALKDYQIGEEVEVFIYLDNKRRKTASTHIPLITASKPAFLEVVGEKPGLGLFLNMNLSKDLLLSYEDIPFSSEFYPKIGDKLFVELKVNNFNFKARILPKQALIDNLTPTRELKIMEEVESYVVYSKKDGITCFTLEGHEIFVYYKYLRERYRVGEKVIVTILNKKDFRTYNGTTIKQKENQMEPDAKKIYEYLEKHHVCFLSDNSSPIEIYQTFQMSKAAFKRAIGMLYKAGKIIIEKDSIIFNK